MKETRWLSEYTWCPKLPDFILTSYFLYFRGACHQAVSDFQFIVNKPLGKLMEVRDELSPKKGMYVTTKATLGFIWKYLGKLSVSYERNMPYHPSNT